MLERINRLAVQGPVEIMQDDTFFHCPNGRLKLRELSSTDGQLIFYQRADKAGPKESHYFITTTQGRAVLPSAVSYVHSPARWTGYCF